jgi:hypothetical protein
MCIGHGVDPVGPPELAGGAAFEVAFAGARLFVCEGPDLLHSNVIRNLPLITPHPPEFALRNSPEIARGDDA